jgi:hypothetical protein
MVDLEPNQFSIKVKERILNDFPEWRNYWKIETKELTKEQDISYIIFEIPTPIKANVDSDLLIYTMDEEITVCFDYYHSHFDDWKNSNDYDGNMAYYFVKNIIMEKVGVISYWQDYKWKGSSQIIDINNYQPGFKTIYNRIRIRSWNGSFNIDRKIV